MHIGGPNASPTVTDSGLLSMSKDGQIMLLNLEDGKTKWTQELGKILKIETPTWGVASSPVVLGDRVYLAAGQVAALDLQTGKTIWVSETKYHPGYTTVVPFQQNGKSFIASLGGKELIVLNQADGTEVAHHPFKARYDMVASTPMVSKDGSHIFISGNMGSEMLSFDGQKLELSWENRDVKSSLNNSVLQGSVIYGISGNHKSSASQLIAFNATDGSIRWSADRFGYGSTIGIGTTLLTLTETGDLVTIPMKTDGFQEISRKTVLDSICWTPPTYANGRIYVRNDEGDLVCLAPKK
jgi:outer membrane protein assembly factor BamB